MDESEFHEEIAGAHDKVFIVDFGSQVTQLIARRVREAGVYCEIAPVQNAEKAFAELAPKAIILSGGPASVHRRRRAARAGRTLRPPACRSSASAMASKRWRRNWAARSRPDTNANSAAPRSRFRRQSALFDGVWEQGKRYPVWMSHGDA